KGFVDRSPVGRRLLLALARARLLRPGRVWNWAIALDPDYALAYAGLAECHLLLRRGGWVSEAAGRPAAERAPAREMALDPMLPEVQLHRVGSSCSWSCVGSGRTVFARSARGETRWSVAHGFYGVFLAFAYRHDEAVAHVNAALDLDPLSPVVHGVCAMAMDLCREHLKAEHLIRRTLDLQADHIVGLWGLADPPHRNWLGGQCHSRG